MVPVTWRAMVGGEGWYLGQVTPISCVTVSLTGDIQASDDTLTPATFPLADFRHIRQQRAGGEGNTSEDMRDTTQDVVKT